MTDLTPKEWPELSAAIRATRTARDNSAHAAQKATAIGIPTLGDELSDLAASYDKLLANLLYLQNSQQVETRRNQI